MGTLNTGSINKILQRSSGDKSEVQQHSWVKDTKHFPLHGGVHVPPQGSRLLQITLVLWLCRLQSPFSALHEAFTCSVNKFIPFLLTEEVAVQPYHGKTAFISSSELT